MRQVQADGVHAAIITAGVDLAQEEKSFLIHGSTTCQVDPPRQTHHVLVDVHAQHHVPVAPVDLSLVLRLKTPQEVQFTRIQPKPI